MRILICTSENGTNAGGLALHCVQLKEIYEKLGHQVDVQILLNPNDYFVIEGGYDSTLADKIRMSYLIKNMSEKYGIKTDLCVACGAGKTAYIASLFCRTNQIPLDIVLCGSEVNISVTRSDLCFFNREAFKYATHIVGLSEELNKNAKLIYNNCACRYSVIPNICNISIDVPVKKISKGKVIYASGATYLSEKKGIANLILAFSHLINDFGRTDILYLFGKIDEDIREAYARLIIENKLQDNVILCGYLKREEFHKKMAEVDVYIQASPFEGFANSVAEALQNGKSILLSNTGYIAETIYPDYPEFIFESLEPKDMAEVMSCYAEKLFIEEKLKAVRKILRQKLSEDYVLKCWSEILSESKGGRDYLAENKCYSVMFHDIDNCYNGIDYALEGFDILLRRINEQGYRLCSARDYFESSNHERLIVCTFDDGYENVYKNAFPIMQRYGYTATVYVCPDLIGKYNDWNHKDDANRKHLSHEMLLELKHAGWEIGSHGMSHINLVRLSETELIENLSRSQKELSSYGPIDSFCYPYGSFKPYIREKVKKYYKNAFSVDVGGCDPEKDRFQITRLTPEQLKKRLE